MKSSSGSYVLFIHVKKSTLISIGRLGCIKFSTGIYAYVGSAMKGQLFNRVYRHTKPPAMKKTHWHIDFLLNHSQTTLIKILLIPSQIREECCISNEISKHARSSIHKFGSTDCKCHSHLYFLGKEFPSTLFS